MLSLTLAELARHDGTDPSLPIYVAIKGVIYDVSTKRESYGPGCGYHVFAGKDPSKVNGSERGQCQIVQIMTLCCLSGLGILVDED